jgi:F-box interacting protein
MLSYLPEEVVLNILGSLPPKFLFRFRCVCKTWRTLIGNPDFFTPNPLNRSFLRDPKKNPPAPLLFVNYKNTFYFLSDETLECQSKTIAKGREFKYFKIVASCNGLLCLYQHAGKIHLWNPATSEVIKSFPRLPDWQFDKGARMKFGAILITVGFGFDRRSNDFKVLRICNVVRNNRSYICGDLRTDHGKQTTNRQVEVYSLSTRRWRLLDLSVPFDELCIRGPLDGRINFPTTASDGVFFWWVVPTEHFGKRYGNEEIVAFDFSDELFRTTPLPDGAHFSHYSKVNFTVLNGSVAIMGCPQSERKRKRNHKRREKLGQSLVIWVLFEFGVKESWTKLINIPVLLNHPEKPLGLWRDRGLIIQNEKGQLVLYDLLTHAKKDVLQIHGNYKNKILLRVFPYTSLMKWGKIGA